MLWTFEPGVLVGCAALAACYLWACRAASLPRKLAFVAAEAALLGALISPLDALADRISFAAHMAQHLLLLEVAAPLLVLAIPFRVPSPRPLLAWLVGFGTLAFWHIPIFYDAALRADPLHALEHISFVASAFVFWWPVLGVQRRLEPLTAVFYLFARMAANLALGSLIYAAPANFFAVYHGAFGLNVLQDQRLGAILMWAPTLILDALAAPLLLALATSAKAGARPNPRSPAGIDRGGSRALRSAGARRG